MSNEFEDVVLTKLSPKERELLAQEIGLEVEKAMARQETARAEAADPETIRQTNLAKMYPSHGPVKSVQTTLDRTKEAMDAWKSGERWPSNSHYPSMDFEGMTTARATAKEAARLATLDPAAEWDKAQKAGEDK